MALGRVRSREYRNRRVGDFLKELDLTEGRNTGFPKIYGSLRRNGSPAPEFETDETNRYFMATLRIHQAFLGDKPEENQESTRNVPEEYQNPRVKLTDIQKKIVDYLRNNPYASRRELSEQIDGLTEAAAQYQLRKLQRDNAIRRIGADRGGYWVVNE